MRRKILLTFSFIFTMLCSGLALAATNVDVDEGAPPHVLCTIPLWDKEGSTPDDQIAISNSQEQGCFLENTTNETYDVAMKYVAGPDYGTAKIVMTDYEKKWFTWRSTRTVTYLNQSVGSGDKTTPYFELGPRDKVLIYTETIGNIITVDGWVVKRHS